MTAVLAIDLGTSGPKVALVTPGGEVLGQEFEPVPVRLFPAGGAEQAPDQWWAGIAAAARRLLGRGLAGPGDVRAVAVTGQWSGTVAVDSEGRPLMDAVIWMDARGEPYVRRLCGGRASVAGYGPAKLARWVRKTGGAPSLTGKDPVGHINFLRHERPEVHRAADCFLEPVDYLNLRLTGLRAATPATATLHWVTDNRDLGRVSYDDALLRLAGLERARLPGLVPTCGLLGPLCAAAGAELGLPEGTPVATATGDTLSAAVGSGAVADYAAHLYVGTSAWLSCHVPFKRTDVLHTIAALPSALPGRYLASCEQESAGRCLEAVRGLLGLEGEAYAAVTALAAEAPPGSGGVIFTPWLYGERTPVDDHTVRGGFHNLSLETARAHLVRSTLEGVALNARWMQHYVERFARRRLDPVSFIGGGARSDLWCQVMADVLGRRVRRVADPVNANLRGAALLAWVALGELGVEQIAERVAVDAEFEPDPATRAVYDRLYAEFVNIYKANRKIYRRLNAARTDA